MDEQKIPKQRKRVPGLVPIRDKRKRKIPELKPLNPSSHAKIQRDSLIPLKIDFSLIRERQNAAPKLESLNKIQVNKPEKVNSQPSSPCEEENDSSLLRAWKSCRVLSSREIESLTKELGIDPSTLMLS
ncbi:Oidioi.mRNA.OKI2018_I69.XSR.g14461.t1.cds [Oikopleura dioica]|uniref:Oidioi.mRNA.OKI2018_I69.XSR.g14461.t1.cds n=1 Tax=Oikopleura dioica TaxID=34765 RepID=A0ABN7SIR5_OIKDI|nr:Oidioi.mRNA.OKI2018_I69.XSR.g14461.t1.cds [Oikopleura dioica]